MKHYTRLRKHGDVHFAKHVFGDPKLAFWSKVDKSGGCWEWTGYRHDGYGQFHLDGKLTGAHRISYAWLVGTIPEGKRIDHRCLNRSCVRPEHLRLATAKQNAENLSKRVGVRGVTRKSPTRWQARVTHNYRHYHVGFFATPEEAEAAVIAKRNELFTHNDLDRTTA